MKYILSNIQRKKSKEKKVITRHRIKTNEAKYHKYVRNNYVGTRKIYRD